MSLVSISTSLNSEMNLLHLLPVIMLNAKDLLEAEASSLFLTDESEEYLYCEVALGEKGEVIKQFIRLEMGQGIVGWTAKHRQSVLLEDAYQDERFSQEWDKQSGFTTKSLITVPLFVQYKLVGVLEVLNKTKGRSFDKNDVSLLTSLADMAAIAIHNAKLNENLKKRLLEISLIYEFENLISSHVDLNDMGKWLLSRILKILQAKTGSIMLLTEDKRHLRVLEAKGMKEEIIQTLRIPLGEGISGYVAETREALFIQNIDKDPKFHSSNRQRYENNSLISAPLICQGELIGVININNKMDGFSFLESDFQLVKAAASRLALTIKNAHFFTEKVRTKVESERARKLMENIIGLKSSHFPGLDIGSLYKPYESIGGDYYSVFALPQEQVGVLMVDVSGHGLSSALLSVMVNTLVSSFDTNVLESPSQFLIYLNDSLYGRMGGNFLTCIYMVIDQKQDELKYSIGGHSSPILLNANSNKALELKSSGKLLGVLSPLLFEERAIQFQKGDMVALYTDGLVELPDLDDRKYFETEDMKDFLLKNISLDCQSIADQISQTVLESTGATHFDDDVTFLAIRRL